MAQAGIEPTTCALLKQPTKQPRILLKQDDSRNPNNPKTLVRKTVKNGCQRETWASVIKLYRLVIYGYIRCVSKAITSAHIFVAVTDL